MNTEKSDTLVELGGMATTLAVYVYALMLPDTDASMVWFMIAGTAGGAVLSAIGGKAIGVTDMGLKQVTAKIICNLCVVIIFGPLALGWALEYFANQEPNAVAAAVGGCLALFGTSVLIMIVPVIARWLEYLLWKRFRPPPTTDTTMTTTTITVASPKQTPQPPSQTEV